MDLGIGGRRCVVTGASRGIGRATAQLLCEAGAEVLLLARGEADLERAVSSCRGSATALTLDITAADAPERVLGAARGRVDILVNNAGTALWRELEEVPEDDWYAAFELNVMAPKRLMDALLPAMAERGWGRVVNVASSSGKRPSASMPEYSVAKAAQLSLSRLYADRYAAAGVLVNAVCPGPTKSELWMAEGGLLDQARAGDGGSREQTLEATGAKRPIGRLAEVEEIAAAIAFLCSERSSFVSGAAWSVDGGSVPVII
jgi:NAD(P)-dependent dehydrogenase (short-subunit alcohol dehydrogenase family)